MEATEDDDADEGRATAPGPPKAKQLELLLLQRDLFHTQVGYLASPTFDFVLSAHYF